MKKSRLVSGLRIISWENAGLSHGVVMTFCEIAGLLEDLNEAEVLVLIEGLLKEDPRRPRRARAICAGRARLLRNRPFAQQERKRPSPGT